MCATCGCGDDAGVRVTTVDGRFPLPQNHPSHPDDAPDHDHEHGPGHEHGHGHGSDPGRTVVLEQQILAKNDHLAEHNRAWLAARDVVAVNLMSAPGSGKTTLLERTIAESGRGLGVIEGDQETLFDARRIEAAGCPVVQINTGAGCHLDADMTARGLRALDPPPGSTVLIENVGNLVCPALFDLGETARVVIVSTTEGPDKPLKYPQMFVGAALVLVTKIDLLPHLTVSLDEITDAIAAVNLRAPVLPVSSTRGDGMTAWYEWLAALPRA